MDRRFAFIEDFGRVSDIHNYIEEIDGTPVSLENRFHPDIIKFNMIEIPYGIDVEVGWYYQNGVFRRPNESGTPPLPIDLDSIYPRKDYSTRASALKTKLAEVSKACEDTINGGIDVETTEGVEHFSLTLADQTNLDRAKKFADSGVTKIPYHADGKKMRIFSPDEIKAIAKKADDFILYHTTYHSLLKDYMKETVTAEQLISAEYGMKLPTELQALLDEIVKL
jgi:hypothetical protein